jgi:hypothetical protein
VVYYDLLGRDLLYLSFYMKWVGFTRKDQVSYNLTRPELYLNLPNL